MSILNRDEQYQQDILPGVSRTFALTIPQLPYPLSSVITNAYLLCRIADTIEDEPTLPLDKKEIFLNRFIAVVEGSEDAEAFSKELYGLLSEKTLPEEKQLIHNTVRVIRYTHSLNEPQQNALKRCVRIMSEGMSRFEHSASVKGLEDVKELSEYCYFVAGVVGEMLTAVFCDYSEEINQHHDELLALSTSFGQGLQMVNILKDQWEDRINGVSWLPRSHFPYLENLQVQDRPPEYAIGLDELVGLAHFHLQNALEYTLLIPKKEKGIRKFCLWAIGLAVLTLQNIHKNLLFTSGQEVKVSRRTVKYTILATNLTCGWDGALRWLFRQAAQGLPTERLENKEKSIAG